VKNRKSILDSAQAKLDEGLARASRWPYVGVLVRAALNDNDHHAMDMAASIAFFMLLSLFPLFLGLFAIGSLLLDSAEVQSRMNDLLTRLLPLTSELVTRNLESIIRLRGPVGTFSVIVLIWSASKMVGALTRGINNALGFERPYAFYLSPLRNFALTSTVTLLVILTVILAPALEVLSGLQVEFLPALVGAAIESVTGHFSGLVVSMLLLGAIYWLVPYQRLLWRDIWQGVLIAALVLELAKGLFVAYIGNLSRYDAIYGSVSSVIILLVWLYVTARVVLYGTEIASVIRATRIQAEEVEERADTGDAVREASLSSAPSEIGTPEGPGA
jgi:membrane protein